MEKQLWKAADKLRKNIDAAEYKHVVLGLIFLRYMNVGSDVPNVTTKYLNSIQNDFPTWEVFDRFENAVVSSCNKKEQNNKQIQTLIQTRDGLLQKLMSNEINLI